MAYATATDFKQAFGDGEATQLATRVSGGAVDATLGVFLDRASSEMDSRLAVRYAVPIAGAESLKAPCLDIARYRLFDDVAPETVRDRYLDAMRWLADLAAGRAVLMLDAGTVAGAPATSAGAASQIVAVPRTLAYGADFEAKYRGDFA